MIGDDIIAGLVARGIPAHVARGIVTNMTAESGLNPSINERNPTVAGSRGGYGLNQWTGPRRRQFEAFAAQSGTDPSNLNTQLDFTVWELKNSEKSAGDAIMSAPDAATAARLYETQFLRPGIPHGGASGQNVLATAPDQQAPQNALADEPAKDPGFQFKTTAMDPTAFSNHRNALAPLPITYQRFG